jgi:hypothetical protein
MRRVRAVTPHTISERAPLRLAPGELVEVGERDTDWPAFVFVTAAGGGGWVPARHLSADRGTATVRTAYDTTELPTQAGELLEVVAEDLEGGWLWCRSGRGREGWVPLRTLAEDAG